MNSVYVTARMDKWEEGYWDYWTFPNTEEALTYISRLIDSYDTITATSAGSISPEANYVRRIESENRSKTSTTMHS